MRCRWVLLVADSDRQGRWEGWPWNSSRYFLGLVVSAALLSCLVGDMPPTDVSRNAWRWGGMPGIGSLPDRDDVRPGGIGRGCEAGSQPVWFHLYSFATCHAGSICPNSSA